MKRRILVCAAIALIAVRMGFYGHWAYYHYWESFGDNAGPLFLKEAPCYTASKLGQGKPCPVPEIPSTPTAGSTLSEAYVKRALYFVDMQQHALAASDLESAVTFDPSSSKAWLLAGRLALMMADRQLTERYLGEALKRSPEDPDVLATHAKYRANQGDLETAYREYYAVLKNHPRHDFARKELVGLLLDNKEYQAALSNINYMIWRNKLDDTLLARRADLFLKLDRPQDAIADYTSILSVNPPKLMYLIARAQVYEKIEDYDHALQDYTQILGPVGSRPNYAISGDALSTLLLHRAALAQKANRPDAGMPDVRRAIQIAAQRATLKMQIALRQNGFENIQVTGRKSDDLESTVLACMEKPSCRDTFQQPFDRMGLSS